MRSPFGGGLFRSILKHLNREYRLKSFFAGRRFDMQEMRRNLSKTAEAFGLPFRGSDKIYNSRLAQELGLWSESNNRGDEFHAAVFKAYFVDGKNIASIPGACGISFVC